jgi:hypothetical protein
LLEHLSRISKTPVLIGTWADGTWAIKFNQKHGFRPLPREGKDKLPGKYWTIHLHQIESSAVLASSNWGNSLQA